MRRIVLVILTVVAISTLASGGALAAIQWTAGPTVTNNGMTVTASGSVTGLSNGKVRVVLAAVGPGMVQCINPGGHVNPSHSGPRPHIVRQTHSVMDTTGAMNFSITTPASQTLSPKQHLCPNSHWTARLKSIDFKRALLAIIQNGQVLYKQSFKLQPAH